MHCVATVVLRKQLNFKSAVIRSNRSSCSSCCDFVHRPRPRGRCVPFELEPIVNCEFSTFVLRGNKDRYYGTDTPPSFPSHPSLPHVFEKVKSGRRRRWKLKRRKRERVRKQRGFQTLLSQLRRKWLSTICGIFTIYYAFCEILWRAARVLWQC